MTTNPTEKAKGQDVEAVRISPRDFARAMEIIEAAKDGTAKEKRAALDAANAAVGLPSGKATSC